MCLRHVVACAPCHVPPPLARRHPLAGYDPYDRPSTVPRVRVRRRRGSQLPERRRRPVDRRQLPTDQPVGETSLSAACWPRAGVSRCTVERRPATRAMRSFPGRWMGGRAVCRTPTSGWDGGREREGHRPQDVRGDLGHSSRQFRRA